MRSEVAIYALIYMVNTRTALCNKDSVDTPGDLHKCSQNPTRNTESIIKHIRHSFVQ
jgi:hypothetical protein